jgi:hypothetical protein
MDRGKAYRGYGTHLRRDYRTASHSTNSAPGESRGCCLPPVGLISGAQHRSAEIGSPTAVSSRLLPQRLFIEAQQFGGTFRRKIEDGRFVLTQQATGKRSAHDAKADRTNAGSIHGPSPSHPFVAFQPSDGGITSHICHDRRKGSFIRRRQDVVDLSG